MIYYRIYVSYYSKGYKRVGKEIPKKHLIRSMDAIMKHITKFDKVLVIGHDMDLDYDFPVFLNLIDDYQDFKEENKSKKRVKKLEEKNNNIEICYH